MAIESPLLAVGGALGVVHARRYPNLPDLSSLQTLPISQGLLELARATWVERAQSEYRSIQILTRFLGELLASGAPIDMYSGVLDLIQEEVRHAELCAHVARAFGAQPQLPTPLTLRDPSEFLSQPMPLRALISALTMLGVNETLSLGFIEDLLDRCELPDIRAVLLAIAGDEAEHQDLGWSYIRAALQSAPATLPALREVVARTLLPHERTCERILGDVPPEKRTLDAWPEPELVRLGLHGKPRQALVYRRTLERVLKPRLALLDLS